jgi:hypothetical protein
VSRSCAPSTISKAERRLSIWKKVGQIFRRSTKHEEFVSIVILLGEPRDLPEYVLRAAAERAWKCKFEGTDENPDFVMQKNDHSVVCAGGHFLTVVNSARPYGDNPVKQAEVMKDVGQRKAWLEHRGFTSIDYVRAIPLPISLQDKYAVLAKLAAELLRADYTGICLPGENQIIPAHADLENQLRNFSSLERLYG